MYETETAAQQPINQLQNNGGHSGAKALLADDGCCVVGEHNNHLIVAECTNLASLVLTNGQEAAVMNAPLGGGGQRQLCLNTRSGKKSGINRVTVPTSPNRWSHPDTSASSLHR